MGLSILPHLLPQKPFRIVYHNGTTFSLNAVIMVIRQSLKLVLNTIGSHFPERDKSR